MANKVQLKKSSVASRVPLTTDVDYGELALNYTDGKLYYKKSDGTTIDYFPSAGQTVSPSGVGASGTWGINISGSAGSVAWSGITSKPTTISGYGITDAQPSLVSGTNIKTVNGNSLLGSGDLVVTATTATYAANSSKLYSTDTTYAYGGSNPYYGYLTYNTGANRWRFQVSPATPAAVEVAYADTSGSVTGLTLTSSANGINPDSVTQNQVGYNTSVSLFGQTDGGLYSSAYNSTWIHQIYGDFRTGQLAVRGKNSGTWQPWRTVLDSSNFSNYAVKINDWHGSLYHHTDGRIYSTIYYDANDSGYYVDANSTSRFLRLRIGDGASSWIDMLDDESPNGVKYLHANSNYLGFVSGYGGWVFRCDNSGNTIAEGNVTAYSDERLKKNWIGLPDDFIENVAKVKNGTYERIDNGVRLAGSSAQDWLKLLPEVVNTTNDESKTLSLAYGNAALVTAIELSKRVIAQEARIKRLESLIEKLI